MEPIGCLKERLLKRGTNHRFGNGYCDKLLFAVFAWVYQCNNDLGAGILPVEFVEVSASVRGQDVRVGWTTSKEVNNDFFTVERSGDGYQFESV